MTWNEAYKIAEKYYTDHGNLLVPQGYLVDGFNLYSWISRQRRCYSVGRSLNSSEEHKPQPEGKLLSNGSELQPEAVSLAGKPEEKCLNKESEHELEEKSCIKDDSPMPKEKSHIEGDRLKPKEKPLTAEQISALESIGMVWDMNDYSWERAFAVAEKYYREHGNLIVPKHYEEDGVNLSHWIWTQRRIVNGTKSERSRPLSEDQIRRLEKIGMVWAPKSKGFSYYYGLAKKFYDAYGHTDFPEGEVTVAGEVLPESGEALAAWKREQEDADFFEKQDGRAKKKRALLHEIGIGTDHGLSQWEKKYRAAEQYYREHGDLLVPFSYITEDGIRLGKWISNQRIKRRGVWGKPPTEEQIRKLDAIGMSWDETENRGKRGKKRNR